MDFLRKILFKFSKFSRTQKQSLLLVVDFLVLDISLYLSFMLRFEELYPQKFINQDIWLFILLPIVTIPFFVILGLYRAVLKHIGQKTTVRDQTLFFTESSHPSFYLSIYQSINLDVYLDKFSDKYHILASGSIAIANVFLLLYW